MSNNVMIVLGGRDGFTFSLSTAAYQSFRRETQWRWASQERIGTAPAQQFVGAGEDTIELEGVILPAFKGGLGQIARMRAMAGRGEPLEMVATKDRVGYADGLWCIRSIEETQTHFLADGAPQKIEFRLDLVAYGEDSYARRDR